MLTATCSVWQIENITNRTVHEQHVSAMARCCLVISRFTVHNICHFRRVTFCILPLTCVQAHICVIQLEALGVRKPPPRQLISQNSYSPHPAMINISLKVMEPHRDLDHQQSPIVCCWSHIPPRQTLHRNSSTTFEVMLLTDKQTMAKHNQIRGGN